MKDHQERIEATLGLFEGGRPRDLRAYLAQPGPDFKRATGADVEAMVGLLLGPDPNQPARLRFSNLLRAWDNAKDGDWTAGTPRNTAHRRRRIHELLKTGEALAGRIDGLIPFYPLDEPLVIAKEHRDWYRPTRGVRDYYWSTYVRYLRERRGWDDVSLLNLENSTRAIMECLADPEWKEAYASRGLVVGYVQSGKTANFAGVVARAADAGYRLVIVLAGTWNILRNQTQRRFDKELLGKELLRNDEGYQERRPPDWGEFLERGADPSDLGHFSWQRLTRPELDFRGLKAAIDGLEFQRSRKDLPINHPENLHRLDAKLLVVKKNAVILRKLAKDLRRLHSRISEIPALVIDDESDQAGLNTVDPKKAAREDRKRTATNDAIVDLLRALPRCQYVGYTATPYANSLVNPDDPEDLFPKDFIVSLERPVGYMGISDFFDPYTAYEDLPEGDYGEPEIAFIRRVEADRDDDDGDLMMALRSYVLAGAIKLYRQNREPGRYRTDDFRHHTMLVHTSHRRHQHESLRDRVRELWDRCAFNAPGGLVELQALWEKDHSPVCRAQGSDELIPASFEDLVPHLSEAIARVTRDNRFVRVVNSDTDEAPDFSAGPVWKIIIGGNTLSRGYTIEGLTVSYYRRLAGTADTLMQMGRWFGFRPGYRDLVRVFLGVKEGGKGKTDLVALFKGVCRMEERFREELKRYVRREGAPRITPKQIPPLIAVIGNLPPTARNKMFNARVKSKNFGGRWSMPTLAPIHQDNIIGNLKTLQTLLSSAMVLGSVRLGDVMGQDFACLAFECSNEQLCEFLASYRWYEDSHPRHGQPREIGLQLEFLKQQEHGITSWLVVAPQRQNSFGSPLSLGGLMPLSVKERHREDGQGFQVFGESLHRKVAEFLAGCGEEGVVSPNRDTAALMDKHRGVMLLYPVRERTKDEVSVGFEMFFPKNRLDYDLHWTVVKPSEAARVVVDARHE